MKTLHNHGLGHTCGLWASDQEIITAWAMQKPASPIIVNGPTSQGSVGYSTGLTPSMSLGCGPLAGNITSENITARHLLNVKRLAPPMRDWSDRYVKDMARASSLTGDMAPRGSGLPGDPSLGADMGGRRDQVSAQASNWEGNASRVANPAPEAAVVHGSPATSMRAPVFTGRLDNSSPRPGSQPQFVPVSPKVQSALVANPSANPLGQMGKTAAGHAIVTWPASAVHPVHSGHRHAHNGEEAACV